MHVRIFNPNPSLDLELAKVVCHQGTHYHFLKVHGVFKVVMSDACDGTCHRHDGNVFDSDFLNPQIWSQISFSKSVNDLPPGEMPETEVDTTKLPCAAWACNR